MEEATQITGVAKRNICLLCKDNRRTAGAYMWKYHDLA